MQRARWKNCEFGWKAFGSRWEEGAGRKKRGALSATKGRVKSAESKSILTQKNSTNPRAGSTRRTSQQAERGQMKGINPGVTLFCRKYVAESMQLGVGHANLRKIEQSFRGRQRTVILGTPYLPKHLSQGPKCVAAERSLLHVTSTPVKVKEYKSGEGFFSKNFFSKGFSQRCSY